MSQGIPERLKEAERILQETKGEITEEYSFSSPVLRRLYLQGYRVVLPARAPDMKLRGLLFCSRDSGKVKPYLFSVHVGDGKGDQFLVVKNYLDFVAVSVLSDELCLVPVLTATSIGRTARIFRMEGWKVGAPDYGRFYVLPAENGQLWEEYRNSPHRWGEKLLKLLDSAVEIAELRLELS